MRYASMREMDISNGEGFGVSLFVQGCHFKCKNCFNSETWDFNGGKKWTENTRDKFLELVDLPHVERVAFLGGEPLADENLESILDLVNEIRNRYNQTQYIVDYKDKNHNILTKNTDEIRISFPTKTIWLYTGYTWEQIMHPVITGDFNPNRDKTIKMRQDIVKQCDVLVDGRYIDELRDVTLHWCGSSNQRVIDVKKTLQANKIVLLE